VKIKNLTANYLNEEHRIFDKLTLELPENGLWLIKGKNGVGKSTLLKLIYGQEVSGLELTYDQFEVPQLNKILLTVDDSLPLDFSELDLVEVLFHLNNVEHNGYTPLYVDRKLSTYSLGELKLATFKIIYALEFELILIDEYIANLYQENLGKVINFLKEMSNEALIIVVSNEEHIIEHFNNQIEIVNEYIY